MTCSHCDKEYTPKPTSAGECSECNKMGQLDVFLDNLEEAEIPYSRIVAYQILHMAQILQKEENNRKDGSLYDLIPSV